MLKKNKKSWIFIQRNEKKNWNNLQRSDILFNTRSSTLILIQLQCVYQLTLGRDLMPQIISFVVGYYVECV